MSNISIQKQVTVRIIPTLLIFWIATCLTVSKLVTEKTNELLDSSLKETAERLLPLALLDIEQRSQINADIELVPLPLNDEMLSYQIQNKDNIIILRSHKSPIDKVKDIPMGFNDYQDMRIYGSSTEDGSYKIYVFEPLNHRNSALTPLLLYFLIPFLLIIPASYWAIRNVLKFLPLRLNEYNSQLHTINQGFLEPISLSSLPSELRGIGESVNTLINRLKKIITAEQNFSENISHELRTPIAIARAQLDVLQLSLNTEQDLTRLAKVKKSIQQLEHLITKFLQISRAVKLESFENKKVNLLDITNHIIDQLQMTNNRIYKVITHSKCPDIKIDPEALNLILINILENAAKYSPPDSLIKVILGPGPKIKIQNQSPPLSGDAINKIMCRYQRNSKIGIGFGIGLSIIQTLVDKYDGHFELTSPIAGTNSGVEARLIFNEFKELADNSSKHG